MNPWLRRALLAVIGIELAVLVARQLTATPPAVAPAPAPARNEEPQGIEAVALAEFPERIADAADVLGGFQHAIEWLGQGWRDDLGIEIHVVTLRSPVAKIETLANQIFEERRVGADAPSGGVLVLLNPRRGEARIEVSYSLEHVFPDLIVGRIARDQLAPYAAYRVAGMAVMDVLHFLKDYAYLQAVRGALALPDAYRGRPEFIEKARYLSGGAGARATLAMAEQEDRDFKAALPADRRARYAPSRKALESAEAYLRTQADQVGDPTLDLYTPGSRCMLDASPYAPFEQLERLSHAEASKPLRVRVDGDHAVADSERPAHGFVPILLERRDGFWRIDLVETWKNLFFDNHGEYHQQNSAHPYAFALDRFGLGAHYGVEPWRVATGDPVAVRRVLAQRGRAFDEYLIAELLFRNCWLPVDALSHYERAIELSPHNLLFNETLAGRAAYVSFWGLAASAYAELGSAGVLWLAHAQRTLGDLGGATTSVRRALDRDRYWIEAHELLGALLEAQGDHSGADAEKARVKAIRSDPRRPGAPLTMTFDPPYPVLHGDAPTKVDGVDVYDHSYFAVTLANPSARDVEIESAILISDGTAQRSGLGDIKDYWQYPSGPHRLRGGESVRLARTWGFTVKTGHQQLRYAFDVCWKADGERQCRDYRVDAFPTFDDIGLAHPEVVASARVPTEDERTTPAAIAARLELLALLRAQQFDELTRRVESAQAAFEADPAREELVAQTWDTFATSDPSITPLLEAWAEASESYAPRVALGIHHRRSGWDARGPRLPSKTSRDQFDAMGRHFERAHESLSLALAKHPRLAIALENLINIAKSHSSSETDARQLVERAAQVCPSCVGPPYEHLLAVNPRWGGSEAEMEQYLADLAPRIAKLPPLAVLRGAIADNRGFASWTDEDYAASVRHYDEALRHGNYWRYRRYRGQSLYWLGRYDEALVDIEFWVDHGTRTAEALMWKTYTLGKLRRYREAADAIDLARRFEPTDSEIAKLANHYWGDRRAGG